MNRCEHGHLGYLSLPQPPPIEVVRPVRSRSPAFESAYSRSYMSYMEQRPRLIEKLCSNHITEERLARERAEMKRCRSFIDDGEAHCAHRINRGAYQSVFDTRHTRKLGYPTHYELDAKYSERLARESRFYAEDSQAPPQTIELYEGSDDEQEDETKHNIASKLGGPGAEGYIDTIVNFNEKEGELNISNIVKIGDQYIKKEWNCGKEYRQTLANNSASKYRTHSSPRRGADTVEMDDTFDPSRMTASRKLFDEDEQSVEPNPTIDRKGFTKHRFNDNIENCD